MKPTGRLAAACCVAISSACAHGSGSIPTEGPRHCQTTEEWRLGEQVAAARSALCEPASGDTAILCDRFDYLEAYCQSVNAYREKLGGE